MSKSIGWERRLTVAAEGKGLVGHAGAVLLRRCADKAGLTSALSAATRQAGRSPIWDRGVVLVQLAVAVVLGAVSIADIALLEHQRGVFGAPPSDSTVRRGLDELDDRLRARIAKARAKVRAHVWELLADREGGFPWVRAAGKLLCGWVVIDMDATLITAHSDKEGAAATYKRGFGFHPLGAWCQNTAESLAMLLRPGNAGANTVADHLLVLREAIAQVPARFRRRILIRLDGAGASRELMEAMIALRSPRRDVLFITGWKTTDIDEAAIAALPEHAWTPAVDQDGEVQPDAHVAEITGLDRRLAGWPSGVRLIVRRSRPSARHERKLTAFEKATGWRYQIAATNIVALAGIPGSHHAWFLDVLYRARGGAAEASVRVGKAMGLARLPSQTWNVNLGWMLAANLANDLHAWAKLLGLADDADLSGAEPETLRFRLWHLPARLATHARARVLKISADWPWANAFTTCWNRLAALPDPG